MTEIDDSAFEGCTNLRVAVCPGIESIGENAFKGCTLLREFKIPTAVSSLGNNAFEGIASVNTVLNSIYDNVNAMARAAGAVKAYATGGLVDYTGLASVHGTPGKPELMLNASDTERFLEAAQILRENQLQAALSRKIDTGFIGLDGLGSSIGPIDFHVDIDHVLDYNDFVTQLQADPKFEKLIDTMTMGRMLGGSKFAKNGIKF